MATFEGNFGASVYPLRRVEVTLPCAGVGRDDPHCIEQLGRESVARVLELGDGHAWHSTACPPSALFPVR